MIAKNKLAALLLSCAGMFSSTAYADDCAPLKLLSTVDLLPVPGSGSRLMVPVTINGTPLKMMLATAGAFTTLTNAAAQRLNLHPIDDSRIKLLDSAGNASRKYVTVNSFQIGALKGSNMEFLITPNPDATFDGTFAGDIMMLYDVEMDFAAHKMMFFSSDHCEGKVIYWPATALAVVPFKMEHPDNSQPGGPVHFSIFRDSHIRVPVTLDGKTFLAVLNTVAPNSTMDAETAQRVFGVTADSPGSTPLGEVGGDPAHKVFGHVFGSLTFDGISVTNPHVAIIPKLIGKKDPDNSLMTGSHISRVDDGLGSELTIGMDVLRKLHIFIAFGEKKLYITPATAPAANTASAIPAQ